MDYYDLEPHGLGLPHSYVTLTCCDIFHNQAMLWKCGYLCSWDCTPYVQQHGACAEEKIPAFKFVRDILYLEYHAGVFPNETHCKHSETDLILISLFSQPRVGETKNLKRKRWHTL